MDVGDKGWHDRLLTVAALECHQASACRVCISGLQIPSHFGRLPARAGTAG